MFFYWSCCYTATKLENIQIRTTLSKKDMINKGRVTNKQFSHLSKKRRAEFLWTRVLQFLLQEKEGRRSKAQGSWSFLSNEPLPKGATDMNELYCWICNLRIYSFILWYILHFSKWMFPLAITQLGLYHKTEEYSDQGCSLWKKQQLGLIEKCLKWNVPSKKRRIKLFWIRVLQFLIRGKGWPKMQSTRFQEFFIKESIA